MNTKNRLIEKLLKVAKKHKVLTYPVLALVAVISVFNYFFSWSTGAGKRVVAIVMVLVMLVSQSYFLTSSANALVDTEETMQEQQELQEESNGSLVDDSEVVQDDGTGESLVESEKATEAVSATETTSVAVSESATETVDVTEASSETSTEITDSTTATEEGVFTEDTTTATGTTANGEDEEETPVSAEEEPDNQQASEVKAAFSAYQDSGTASGLAVVLTDVATVYDSTTNTYSVDVTAAETTLKEWETRAGGYISYVGWYSTSECKDSDKVDVSKLPATLVKGNMIHLYAKKTLSKYKVIVNTNGGKIDKVLSDEIQQVTNTDGTYLTVPASQTTFSLKVSMDGHTIVGATGDCTANVGVDSDDGTIQITLSTNSANDSYSKTIDLKWEAGGYNIRYTDDEGDNEYVQKGVKFDSEVACFAQPSSAIKNAKPGYVFDHWKIDVNGTTYDNLEAGKSIAAYTELQTYLYNTYNDTGSPATLTAVYRYAGVELDKESVTYQYRKANTKQTIFKAVYTETGETSASFIYNDFTCTLPNGGNLEDYGIKIVKKSEGISVYTDSEGPKKSTGTITVSVNVEDTNVPEGAAERSSTLTFSIIIDKCTVALVPSDSFKEQLTKTYDGNTECKFGETTIDTNLSHVYVKVSGGEYVDANAGEREIALSDATIYVDDAAYGTADDYILASDKITGTIEQRTVFINTKVSKESVRAGEANPDFSAEVITRNDGSANGFIGDDAKNINSYLKLTTYPERDDSKLTETNSVQSYEVRPVSVEGSNYIFDVYSDVFATFEVRLESAADRYIITGDHEFDWYGIGTELKPKDGCGYDRIRLEDGTSDDAIILTEDNTPDNLITFQLYDSQTGAYTSFVTKEVKVDLTAPEYVDYELLFGGSNSDTGLYFPSENGAISFGNYYNKSLTFRVRYKDEKSQPYKLYYTLDGTLGGADGAITQEVTFNAANTDQIATTEFSIALGLVDKIGTIEFYAVDRAGNKSLITHLERHGDEWAVEDTSPSIGDLILKSCGTSVNDGITVPDGSMNFYSDCTAYLHAEDATSGIYSVTWVVNGTEYEEKVGNYKRTSVDFETPINASKFASDDGVFELYAYVTDNAGNESLTTRTVTFQVDDVDPILKVADDYDISAQEVKIKFSAYDELSGVKYINVKNKATGEMIQHVVESVEDGVSECYVTTSKKGTYIIEVSDYAGNVIQREIVLSKVSNEIPPCPEVTFSQTIPENGWVTTDDLYATITNVTKTLEDDTAVTTKYQLWKDGKSSQGITSILSSATSEKVSFADGIYELLVWSESETGVMCVTDEKDGHHYTIQVDSSEPVIGYQLTKGSGSTLVVNFTVMDSVSGVDGETIQVMRGSRPVTAQITELADGSGYSGSFEITETGNYTITAKDIAGNKAYTEAFTPMSMKVNAVKNITDSAATVGARIIKGSYPIKSASIAYRKYTDTAFIETEALPVVDKSTGNQSISTVLSELQKGTAYVYKITAVSEANEVLEYTGYFRTLSDDEAGILVTGTARYADGRKGSITVGLFEGQSCIRAVEVDTSKSNAFTFTNVPDGNYNVVATDGIYSKTARILVNDGLIIYPDGSGIDLVLSGKNTSVEITTEDTPNVTAGNMDSLFEDETNYTEDERELVAEEKGTVEFKLYATLMKASSVDSEAISAMYSAATNKNKLVGAYLDLSLYKIVTDENGEVTRTQVHKLGGGANVSVTIPLGDLANKSGLEVIRIHQNGDTYTGAYLTDKDTNPSTYTITTTQFSTYAILYDPDVVAEDPDSGTPTTPENPSTGTPTTDIKDGTLAPASNGVINRPTEETEAPEEDEPEDGKNDGEKPKTGHGSSVGSLRSSGSAKTGDETPIAVLFGFMMLSMGGVVVLRKKTKNN